MNLHIGEFLRQLNDIVWPVFLQMAIFATAILVFAAIANLLLRRRSAALKHRLWALAMLCLLVLPLADIFTPRVSLISFIPSSTVTPAREEISSLEIESLPGLDSPAFELSLEEDAFSETLLIDDYQPEASSLNTVDVPWQTIIVWLWLSGMLLKLLGMTVSHWQSLRLAAGSQLVATGSWKKTAEALVAKLHLSYLPVILQHERVQIFQTLGWMRPKIILPCQCASWSTDRWRVVLSHELAHIARGDLLWQLASQLACAIYWPHPLVWIARRQLSHLREIACDDQVILAGEKPETYAAQLLEVVSTLAGRGRVLNSSLAMAGAGSVEQRIRSILQAKKPWNIYFLKSHT